MKSHKNQNHFMNDNNLNGNIDINKEKHCYNSFIILLPFKQLINLTNRIGMFFVTYNNIRKQKQSLNVKK